MAKNLEIKIPAVAALAYGQIQYLLGLPFDLPIEVGLPDDPDMTEGEIFFSFGIGRYIRAQVKTGKNKHNVPWEESKIWIELQEIHLYFAITGKEKVGMGRSVSDLLLLLNPTSSIKTEARQAGDSVFELTLKKEQIDTIHRFRDGEADEDQLDDEEDESESED